MWKHSHYFPCPRPISPSPLPNLDRLPSTRLKCAGGEGSLSSTTPYSKDSDKRHGFPPTTSRVCSRLLWSLCMRLLRLCQGKSLRVTCAALHRLVALVTFLKVMVRRAQSCITERAVGYYILTSGWAIPSRYFSPGSACCFHSRHCFWQGSCTCITFSFKNFVRTRIHLYTDWFPISIPRRQSINTQKAEYVACFWVCTLSHLFRTECCGIFPRKSAMCFSLIRRFKLDPKHQKKIAWRHNHVFIVQNKKSTWCASPFRSKYCGIVYIHVLVNRMYHKICKLCINNNLLPCCSRENKGKLCIFCT